MGNNSDTTYDEWLNLAADEADPDAMSNLNSEDESKCLRRAQVYATLAVARALADLTTGVIDNSVDRPIGVVVHDSVRVAMDGDV